MTSSWVFSTSQSIFERIGHTAFNPRKSKSFSRISGATWDISYADGSGASGYVGNAPVTIGGTTVKSQAVELATEVSTSFERDTNNDGLLGLGFASINTVSPNPVTPWFLNAAKSLADPVFTVSLKKGAAGSYDFGTIDKTKYTGAITYTNVDSSNGFWEFNSPGYKIGNTAHSAPISAIADTGTTLLLMEDAAVDAYYKAIPSAQYDSNQGGYTFPCGTTLPSFSVGITSSDYVTIPGSLMEYAPTGSGSSSKSSDIQHAE
jgi:Eukaryotic aspartyl protease